MNFYAPDYPTFWILRRGKERFWDSFRFFFFFRENPHPDSYIQIRIFCFFAKKEIDYESEESTLRVDSTDQILITIEIHNPCASFRKDTKTTTDPRLFNVTLFSTYTGDNNVVTPGNDENAHVSYSSPVDTCYKYFEIYPAVIDNP